MARRSDDLLGEFNLDRSRDRSTAADERPAPVQRRKLGRIIRNERGGATMEWTTYTEEDAAERVVLQVLETPADGDYSVVPTCGTPAPDAKPGHQPYGAPAARARDDQDAAAPRRPSDLRKLSEWIKMTRKVEGAKRKKRWF
jgi:hypothetical protein